MKVRGALIYIVWIAFTNKLLSCLHLVDIGKPDEVYRPKRQRKDKLDRVSYGNANLALPALTLTGKPHGLSPSRQSIDLQHNET